MKKRKGSVKGQDHSIDVKIGNRLYKAIGGYTIAQLEHMLQLSQIEMDNFKKIISNYPPDRLANCGTPFLKSMEGMHDTVQKVLNKKLGKVANHE